MTHPPPPKPDSETAQEDRENATVGGITWHSSEPDSGPDVGLSVYLGPNDRLWCGEVTNKLFEEQGKEHFASDGGWFLIRYRGDETKLIAKFADDLEAREFIEQVAEWVSPRATAQQAPTLGDVKANVETTLIGFDEELTRKQRDFIADQISRKVLLLFSASPQKAESDWRPIETAPKDGSEFLGINCRAAGVGYRVVYFDDEAKEPYIWRVEDAAKGFNHHRDFLTHWMPLPPRPRFQEAGPQKASAEVSNALHEIVTNGDWWVNAQGEREWKVSEAVYQMAYDADLFHSQEEGAVRKTSTDLGQPKS